MHRPDASSSIDNQCLVSSDYSESMARTFSTHCAAFLPAESKPGAGVDLNCPSKPVVIVRDGDYVTLCKIFNYLNDFCGGKTTFPVHAELPLLQLLGLLDHAVILGVAVLAQKIEQKIAEVARGHPILQDVLAMLKKYSADTKHHAHEIVVESVADAVFRGAVSRKSKALAICAQEPEYSTALNARIEQKTIALAEAIAAQVAAEAKKKADKKAKDRAENDDKAIKNQDRKDKEKADRRLKMAERRAKQDEVAAERSTEQIRLAAKAQRIDTSKPASSFLRPTRGAIGAAVDKSGANGGKKGEKNSASAPISLEIVVGGRTIKIENAVEPQPSSS